MTQYTPQTNPSSPGRDKPLAGDAIEAQRTQAQNKQKMDTQKKPDVDENASDKSCGSAKGDCATK